MHMFTSVADHSVIVTGGSKGIGRGIAQVFADAGAKVLITGRDEASLRAAAEGLGARASYVVTDVTDRDQCEQLAAVAVERHGGIDVLCANAGIFPSARLDVMTPDDLELVMATNLDRKSTRLNSSH